MIVTMLRIVRMQTQNTRKVYDQKEKKTNSALTSAFKHRMLGTGEYMLEKKIKYWDDETNI